MDELVAFLETFVDATKALESDRTPTLHLALPWLHKLKKHCNPTSDDSSTIVSIKKAASTLLDEKFK
jgi:hypothetical protein